VLELVGVGRSERITVMELVLVCALFAVTWTQATGNLQVATVNATESRQQIQPIRNMCMCNFSPQWVFLHAVGTQPNGQLFTYSGFHLNPGQCSCLQSRFIESAENTPLQCKFYSQNDISAPLDCAGAVPVFSRNSNLQIQYSCTGSSGSVPVCAPAFVNYDIPCI